VATDRISAYDVIMKNGVPQKGALLTLMTTHWFNLFKEKIPDLKTHLISAEVPESVAKSLPGEVAEQLRLRTMHVRRLKVLPLESIVRGYITGSAWSEYKKSGTVHGIAMPKGLQESQKLETPLWTPSTQAEVGDKDENISPEEATKIVGEKYAKKIEELSWKVYQIVSVVWGMACHGICELISVYYRLEIMLLSVVSLLLIPSLSLVLMSILMRLSL
jgi:phosphoribosylaminoimidazole-succinocarboxamide synthase